MVLQGRKKLINVTGLYLKPFETKWVIFCEAHKCPGVFLRRHITLNELLVYMCHNIKHWRSALLSKIMWELLGIYKVPLFSELHYLTCIYSFSRKLAPTLHFFTHPFMVWKPIFLWKEQGFLHFIDTMLKLRNLNPCRFWPDIFVSTELYFITHTWFENVLNCFIIFCCKQNTTGLDCSVSRCATTFRPLLAKRK